MTEETIKLALKLANILKEGDSSCSCSKGRWQVGKNYFIRTVTFHYTGRLVEVTENELWLEDAAWIADDGRFMQALSSGSFNEVEPFPSGQAIPIGRGSLLDATIIPFELPRSQK